KKPVVFPEYSYHTRKPSIRVSHEPTSGVMHQAVRGTTISVVAFDAPISILPGALPTTWRQTGRCPHGCRELQVSKSDSATESCHPAPPPRLMWPCPGQWRPPPDATSSRPRARSPSTRPCSPTP